MRLFSWTGPPMALTCMMMCVGPDPAASCTSATASSVAAMGEYKTTASFSFSSDMRVCGSTEAKEGKGSSA